MRTAFDTYHPAVEFFFFLGAIGTTMFLNHPLYIGLSLAAGLVFYLLLKGMKGLKLMGGLLALWAFLAIGNGLLVQEGETILFTWWRGTRTVSLEALLYGVTNGAMFVAVLLWFSCYNELMTEDKFTALFGNLIPSLSLLLCMILRLVPEFEKRAVTITGVRNCVGKGPSNGTKKEKLRHATDILSVMTSWALENSVITADSMKARGYGCGKRISFNINRSTGRDSICATVLLLGLVLLIVSALMGSVKAEYYPLIHLAPLTIRSLPGIGGYALFLFTPTLLQLWEDLTWLILRSKI